MGSKCGQKKVRGPQNGKTTSLLQATVLLQKGVIQDYFIELYDRHARKKTHSLITECSAILRDTLARFSRVLVVIDGLEECPDRTWRILHPQIRDIQHRIFTFITFRHLSVWSNTLPMLFVSRSSPMMTTSKHTSSSSLQIGNH